MSTIKVDTIATRTGSGNITASNTIAGNLTGNVTGNVTGNLTGNSTVGGTLGVTGLVTASAGVAIGGTGSANTIDDYEEGTWSAELRGASSRASTPVISTTAKYTKVGNIVNVSVYFANVNTSGASGTCQVTGLPFTCINQLFPMSVMTYGFDYDDSGGVMSIHMYVENGTTAQLIATKDNAAWQAHGIAPGTGKYFAMQGTYITDS